MGSKSHLGKAQHTTQQYATLIYTSVFRVFPAMYSIQTAILEDHNTESFSLHTNTQYHWIVLSATLQWNRIDLSGGKGRDEVETHTTVWCCTVAPPIFIFTWKGHSNANSRKAEIYFKDEQLSSQQEKNGKSYPQTTSLIRQHAGSPFNY